MMAHPGPIAPSKPKPGTELLLGDDENWATMLRHGVSEVVTTSARCWSFTNGIGHAAAAPILTARTKTPYRELTQTVMAQGRAR